MARGLKLTGFARFFFLLIVLAPLAYIIASYANGQDGIENIKKLFGIHAQGEAASESESSSPLFVPKAEQIRQLQAQVEQLQDSLVRKEGEIEALRSLLKPSR